MTYRLILFFVAISTLAILQNVAMTNHLYWKHLWLDMPMHFLGGVCVALGYSVLPFFKITLPQRFRTLTAYLIFVFIIGGLWEAFELVNGISLVSKTEGLITDTATDMFLDLLGGTLAYYIVRNSTTEYGNN